ncbi:hypothetical protein ACFLZN_02845, partial [Nanoarchaeota archaeon]
MLRTSTVKKINDFVYNKPRTVQEIAHAIGVNWRTADRYVERIEKETGTLSIRTFRKGTRGALKIVYWNNIEKIHSSEFQERILQKILSYRKKEDFSPLDIYQYVDEAKRNAFLEPHQDKTVAQDLETMFRSAQSQILIFSGNLDWATVKQGKTKVIDILEEVLQDKRISLKALSIVDVTSLRNITKFLEINERLGREAVEIRHSEQPLRAVVVDKKNARLKEVKDPKKYECGVLGGKTDIYYEIFDEEWVDWMQKVFWKLFRVGISTKK